MYLKSIEIQGFKSFANRIVFEFHNGITGIVGPNGSGKSNVADAVRWVLGEQSSKSLRGSAMQDVIFAGTELRKAQGFAHVAITLDNSDHALPVDYQEVTVSRRLYRSGESEYKINGTSCRLRDVRELFYDTGIGKEGYSIIGQGQIDKILSGKPDERRELFDEAAGIVKFKRRKKEAQDKLENEQANLVRVNDILAELEKQVGPLSRQAEKAKEYLRLRDLLKVYESNLFLREMKTLREQLKTAGDREKEVSGALEDARAESLSIRTEYDTLSAEMEELEKQAEDLRAKASGAEAKGREAESGINILREQIHTEQVSAEHIQSRLQSISEELERKRREREEEEKKLKELEGEKEKCDSDLEDLNGRLDGKNTAIEFTEARIEEIKSANAESLNDKVGLAAEEQRYATMLEQGRKRKEDLSAEKDRLSGEKKGHEAQISSEEAALEKLSGEASALKKEAESLKKEAEDLDRELRALGMKISGAQQDYHIFGTRLESLRNLAERYEGYGQSIRRVMEKKNNWPGIRGVVADLISTEKGYETAIETALGGSIQNIVTEDEQTAKRLIGFLKENHYGRATFLPLTAIRPAGEFSPRAALSEPGVLGLASDLVTCREEYRKLASYLLGRVVVCDTMDHAIALARKNRYSLRIVTLEGELLSPGGSMTGGSFKNNSNLLGRKREIEELEEKKQSALVRVERLQQEKAKKEEQLSAVQDAQGENERKTRELILRDNTARMSLKEYRERLKEAEDSLNLILNEEKTVDSDLAELEKKKESILGKTREIEQSRKDRDEEIAAKGKVLESLRRERDEMNRSLSRLTLKQSGISQELRFAEENINRILSEEEKLISEREEIGTEDGSRKDAIAVREARIRVLEEEKEKAGREEEELKKKLEEVQGGREQKSRLQKSLFDKKAEIDDRVSSLDRDLVRIQNQEEKLSEKIENQVSFLWNEYELNSELAEKYRDDSLPATPALRREVNGFREQVKALGNINVNAIEDYKQVSGRYEFLKGQHEDLVAAEEKLKGIVAELDNGMRRQFKEKFEEITSEFDRVFRELFGGGYATLELEEDEDILTAGIRIISQPPGKKLQNMMQLSGGEKAMTAIALLFAILNLKPSPFCLLDEIEAALDESNVDRFAEYLHRLTEGTQFIVITHRRGTMVAADRLYGITMQEKGVSTMVSVNLIEDSLDGGRSA